jgi:threonine dehydrogenase-like Zn-dependent dehydrogenase
MAFTNGKGASVGIECSSNPKARSQILDGAKLFGRVAYIGEGKDVHIDVSNQIIHKQLTIIGSWVYSVSDLIELLDFVAKENIDISSLITNEFSLDQAGEAMKLADSGNCGKVMFTWV